MRSALSTGSSVPSSARFLPVSVGVAPSAWLAKCAAEALKPDAVVVWRPDDLAACLDHFEQPGGGQRGDALA